MTPEDDPEISRDPELRRLLEEWSVPGVPDTLDRRVLASYRAHIGTTSLWRRLVTTSIRIPLPVALAALLLLAFAFWNNRRPTSPIESAESTEPTRTALVKREPVVTRTTLAGFEPVREMNVTVVPEEPNAP